MNDNQPETIPETLDRIAELRRAARDRLSCSDVSRASAWEIRRCIRLLDVAENNIRRGAVRLTSGVAATRPPSADASWWFTRDRLFAAFEYDFAFAP